METIYLSLVHPGSWGYLFHEIPCSYKSIEIETFLKRNDMQIYIIFY